MKNRENMFNYNLFILFLMQLSLILPLIMIEAPTWIIITIPILVYLPLLLQSFVLHIILFYLYDIVKPILYVWGLIVTIQGTQDFFAITFYIIAGLQVVNMIKRLFGTVCSIILILFDNKGDDNL